jgi:hypothetical protein
MSKKRRQRDDDPSDFPASGWLYTRFTGEPGDDKVKLYRSIVEERGGEHVHTGAFLGNPPALARCVNVVYRSGVPVNQAKRYKAHKAELRRAGFEVHDWPMGGVIFGFKEMERAKDFAVAAKKVLGLDGRVFDDDETAAHTHGFFPYDQCAPVVHIDLPDEKLGRQVDNLALEFGGNHIGR